jgi:GntR family transcriptional regulator, galactonate operon transcriptional repressor
MKDIRKTTKADAPAKGARAAPPAWLRGVSRHAQVASELGRRIVSRWYPHASMLPLEADLLNEFGVSRTVLREAIKSLESKGMLEARQRRGTVVTPRSHWNLLDRDVLGWIAESGADPEMLIRLNEVRRIVEPGACILAAEMATSAQLQQIEDAWQRMVQHVKDLQRFVEADRDFHLALLAASGNEYLAAIGTAISAALTVSLRTTNPNASSNRASLAGHERIVRALQRRNGALAAQESMRQLGEALRRLRRRT